MRKTFTTFLLLAAPLCALSDEEAIDEIAVTATPRPARLQSIPAAFSIVQGDEARTRSLTTEALEGATGVVVQQTTPGQGAAIIRGLKGSSILHVVDGMRLNNAIFRSAPTQYLALVPTEAIERIEVIRGTPTALYGSEAVGGVVHVLSHVPQFDSDATETGGVATIGFETADLARSVSGTVDIGNSRNAASFGGGYLSTGKRRIGNGERLAVGGFDARSARAYLASAPADGALWSFDLQFLEQPETPRVDELVPGYGQVDPSSSEFAFEPNRRLFAHARHTKDHGLWGLDWRVDIAWQRIDDDRRTRNFESPQRRLEKNRSDLFGADIRASGETRQTSWVVGAEYYDDRVRSSRIEEDIDSGTTRIVPPRFPDDSSVRQSAVFASANRLFSDRHRVSGGLRLSSVSLDIPAAGTTSASSQGSTRLSGDVGWILNISGDWQLLTNLGFGFRAPNIFDIGTLGNRPGNRYNIPSPSLKPETVVHGDLGVRYHSGRTRFELVAYNLDYDDRITSVLTGDVTTDGRDVVQSVNAESTSIYGIEGGLELEVSSDLKIFLNATYTRGLQKLTAGGVEPADRIPPLGGRFGIRWTPADSWTISAWTAAAGNQDRLSARDLRDKRIDPDGSAGWADTVVEAAWVPNETWQIQFGVNNVFGRRYRVHGSGVDAPGRGLSVNIQRSW